MRSCTSGISVGKDFDGASKDCSSKSLPDIARDIPVNRESVASMSENYSYCDILEMSNNMIL